MWKAAQGMVKEWETMIRDAVVMQKNVAISISIVIRFVPLSFILMNTRV